MGQTSHSKTSLDKDQLRILHVDDDVNLLEISKSIFEINYNIKVDTATSADEALQKLEKQSYDAIVSDYEMPQKSGLDFLKELREQNNKIPFALFTGKGREDVAITALNLGADGYFNKQGKPETVYGELTHGIRLMAEKWKAKEALSESENRYRSLMEQAADAIIVHNREGKIVDANKQASKLLGYTNNELLSMSINDISPDATENNLASLWPKILAGQTITIYVYHKHKNGNKIPVEVTISPLTINKEIQIIGLARDITERKKTEDEMRKSEIILQNSSDAIVTIDLQGKIISWNKGACDTFGYSAKEIHGENISKIVKSVDKARIVTTQLETMREGQIFAREWEGVRKDGSSIWLLLNITLLKNSQNEPVGMVGFAKDITNRKRIETQLKDSEVRFKQLFLNMPNAVAVYSAVNDGEDFVFKDFNEAAEQIEKVSRKDVIGKRVTEVFPGVKDFGLFSIVQRVYRTGKSEFFPSHLYHDNKDPGSWRENWIYKLPNGDIVTIYNNVTERKNAEETLRQERDKLEALTENIGSGLVMISKDYKILWMNNYLKNLTGASENNYCYSSFNNCTTICPDCGPKKVFEGATIDRREYLNLKNFNKDHPVWFELIATPIKDKEGNIIAALELTVNITEKKLLQQKILASEAKFRAISDFAVDAIFMFDTENKITYWNSAAAKIFGYTKKEIVGKKVNKTIIPLRYRKNHLKLTAQLGKAKNKKNIGELLEFPALKKDGTEFPLELSIAPLQIDDKLFFVAIGRDCSERNEAEETLNQTMAQLALVNEKLSVVGNMSRHDVKNKLTVISGNAYLLKKKHADQADIVEGLGKIEQTVAEAGRIFAFAKLYEKLGVEKLSIVDVGATVDEAVALFSDLSLKVVNDCQGLTMLADSFLRQLFYNLIDNTRKYGEKTTTIKVHYEKAATGSIQLIYEDNGVGIPKENKSKLFTEGFSTGGSTGFGLFLIKKMMDVYGWTITEEGEPGKGAKFIMHLPSTKLKGNWAFKQN